MSAFGQAGFGSRNRQNQLRAQGQMDPYGNQVRQAKQAPTFNIDSRQPRQATSSPATPRPQPASVPAYGGLPPAPPGVTQPSTPPAQPQTGGPFPTYDDWMSSQGSGGFVNPPTGGPFPTYDSVMGPQTSGPRPIMGQAQPIYAR